MTRSEHIAELRRKRPRDYFLRGSLIVVAILVVYALIAGDFAFSDLFSSKRMDNLERFWTNLTYEDPPGSPRAQIRAQIMSRSGEAVMATLWISIASIVLAGAGASILSGFAARNLSTPKPFISAGHPASGLRIACWALVVWIARAILIVSRAVPEYIWAFLLIGLFGLGAWPAVLALALHNLGILGRLGSETIENQSQKTPAALRALGASRVKIYLTDLVPNAIPRWLVYFFYRWETCVREAAILGMLGVTSIGYFIFNEARPRDLYDVMIYFTLMGAALVFCADLLSALIRWRLRKL